MRDKKIKHFVSACDDTYWNQNCNMLVNRYKRKKWADLNYNLHKRLQLQFG